MDRQWISEPARVRPPYTEPPKRKRNFLRALLILLAVALLAGGVSTSILLYYEQIFASPAKQTVIIHKEEKLLPYPKTRTEVADRFGGKPRDWSRDLFGGWVYMGDDPIPIPIGRNVTLYSDDLTLYWVQELGE